ncbi:MAG: S8 family serine peptidase [Humibacillus sp.]|nr:S8 family serine peptidase [Humibacillus sp.]MDN5779439.1 S8 family serine peptidase [Humibacillus sp.]
MRPVTAVRRAVIVVAATALCVGAASPGPSTASSAGVGATNTPAAAAATPAAGGLQVRPAADPDPDGAATSVSAIVDAAAARAAAVTSAPNASAAAPDDSADGTPGASPAAPATDPTVATRTPASTPVPISTPNGRLMSYIVNAKVSNPAQTQRVSAAVSRAGGVVVQAWPQIGVVIAHSRNGSFRADVVSQGGKAIASVGATRSVAVSEGTPTGVASPDGSPSPADVAGSDDATDPSENGSAVPANPADSPKSTNATANPTTNPTTRPTVATPLLGRADPDPDPLETDQWDLSMIKADQAHQVTDGSRRVVVGVLDSGIDADHPDLVANLDVADSVNCSDAGRPDRSATGWQPTTSDHGTHVAGTIAAARNGVGIVGVAPAVRIASVKVVNDAGYIYPEYAVCGFVWAGLRGMDVTNSSYYIDPFQFYCSDQPDQAAAKEAVRRAVAWSTSRGVVHAAAAGNSGYDLANKSSDNTSPDDGTPVRRAINNGCQDIPTELPGVVTVSSLAQVGNTLDSSFSGFSNRGLGKIDVAAPGSAILSTILLDDGYGLKSGTSMATPHVAGVLALMKSRHPGWKPAQLVARLLAQADPKACPSSRDAPCVGTTARNSYFGHGVVDALAAVR